VLIHRAHLFSCRSGSALMMPVPPWPCVRSAKETTTRENTLGVLSRV
jgi:hypothetical protein